MFFINWLPTLPLWPLLPQEYALILPILNLKFLPFLPLGLQDDSFSKLGLSNQSTYQALCMYKGLKMGPHNTTGHNPSPVILLSALLQ